MPANLTDNYVANTYKGVLHVNGEELPDDARVQVYDGAGNKTAIKLGINSVDCLSLSAQGLTANDFKYPEEPGAVFNVLCQTSENVAGEVNTLELRNIKDILCGTPDAGLASYSRESNSVVPIFNIECGTVQGVEDVEITNITGAAGGINRQSTGNFNVSFISLTGGIVKGLTLTPVSLAPQPNLLINAQGIINQRALYAANAVAGAGINYGWNPKLYFLDKWRTSHTFAEWSYDTPNVATIVVQPDGWVSQIIEYRDIVPGIHTLSWTGNATPIILLHPSNLPVGTSSIVTTGDIKSVTAIIPAGHNIQIRFVNNGSGKTYFSLPKFERGAIRTEFDYRSFGSELLLCQRYFCKTCPYEFQPQQGRGGHIQSQTIEPWARVLHNNGWRFPITLRTTPNAYVISPAHLLLGHATVIYNSNKDADLEVHAVPCFIQEVSDGGISTLGIIGKELEKGVMRAYLTEYVADADF